jgi:gamma-glutamyltranspeptidase/glutathione hydrolase
VGNLAMTTRPELSGSFGMVASTHWLASAAGMSVLERGGNAFDAACAAGFVLQVVEPHLNGPGGDLPVLLWSQADARVHVACGQGVAPAAASIERFAELGLSLVPGSGLLAATVPGAFGAWTLMLERWGTWELADVLEPAIYYAETGFPVLASIARTIDGVAGLFAEHWPTSARAWLDGGKAPAAGRTWRSPQVAQTYRALISAAAQAPTREARIARARAEWYSGFVADAIGKFCTVACRDTSGRDHAGLLTADDLASWAPTVEAPVHTAFAGVDVYKTAAWGQGPVLLQQLRLLEELGIGEVPVRSAQWIHWIVEAAKLCFADREAWYGDEPAVPLDTLLSPAYARTRAVLVTDEADLHLRPGSPDGHAPHLPELLDSHAEFPGVGEPTLASGDTCHLDVADRFGNLVSATPSGGWLHSSPTIPALGFALGTRAQMFFLQPGLPNSLRPGKRPRTTLSPSLALRDGAPWLAFGTPGGDQQDQWQLPFLLDVVLGRAGLQAAIDAPTFHTAHFPSSFYPREAFPGRVVIEDRFGSDVLDDLRGRGHEIVPSGAWSLGRLSAVAREGSTLRAGANPRGAQGYAVGR